MQKTISTQTSGSVFADRIEQVKKTKCEVELIVDCFLDGYGSYDSNLVSFKIKSLQTNHCFLQRNESCRDRLEVSPRQQIDQREQRLQRLLVGPTRKLQ